MDYNKVDFNDSEDAEIKQIQKEKMLWLGDPRASLKKRFFQMIATIVSFLLVKFSTNLRWQFFLVGYLLITLPVGTYHIFKWLFTW